MIVRLGLNERVAGMQTTHGKTEQRRPLKNAERLAALACLAALCLSLGSTAFAQDSALLRAQDAPANALWLDTLDLDNVTQDYGTPQAGKSVDSNPLTLSGIVYPHGLGTHAVSRLLVDLKGSAAQFEALAGVDDEKKGTPLDPVPGLRGRQEEAAKRLSCTAAMRLSRLGGPHRREAHDFSSSPTAATAIDNDHADWAGALLTLAPGAAEQARHDPGCRRQRAARCRSSWAATRPSPPSTGRASPARRRAIRSCL